MSTRQAKGTGKAAQEGEGEGDDSTCGQAISYPFYLEYGVEPRDAVAPPTPWVPYDKWKDNAYSLQNTSLANEWTYRRARTGGGDSGGGDSDRGGGRSSDNDDDDHYGVPPDAPGDVSLTCWGGAGLGEGNDYPYGCVLFLQMNASYYYYYYSCIYKCLLSVLLARWSEWGGGKRSLAFVFSFAAHT